MLDLSQLHSKTQFAVQQLRSIQKLKRSALLPISSSKQSSTHIFYITFIHRQQHNSDSTRPYIQAAFFFFSKYRRDDVSLICNNSKISDILKQDLPQPGRTRIRITDPGVTALPTAFAVRHHQQNASKPTTAAVTHCFGYTDLFHAE